MQPFVYLASRSARRRDLLERIGISFEVLDVAIDEQPGDDELAEVYVLRMALEKARAGFAQLNDASAAPVLAADTAVVVEDGILGKPGDRSEALSMLERLSGGTHRVLTGVALADDREATRLSVSQVTMRTITSAEAERYWATGEPQDKAGAYAVQGRGGVFIEHLEGTYTGVMGLPLFETTQLLDDFGIGWMDGWPGAS